MEARIQKEFDQYIACVFPAVTLSADQRAELKRAFFAGAMTLHTIILRLDQSTPNATEADLRLITALDTELRTFNDQIKRDLAAERLRMN